MSASDRQGVADAFTAAARAFKSQALLDDQASSRCHRASKRRRRDRHGERGVVRGPASVDLGRHGTTAQRHPVTSGGRPPPATAAPIVSGAPMAAHPGVGNRRARPLLPHGRLHESGVPVAPQGAGQRHRGIRVRPRPPTGRPRHPPRDQRTARRDGRQGHGRAGVHHPNHGAHRPSRPAVARRGVVRPEDHRRRRRCGSSSPPVEVAPARRPGAWSGCGASSSTVDPALPGAAPLAEVRGRPARRPDARRHVVELGIQPASGTRRRGEGRPGAGRQGVLPGARRGADRCRRQRCTRPPRGADGQREHAVGDHGHPHPAGSRRQPCRDPSHHRGDPAGA